MSEASLYPGRSCPKSPSPLLADRAPGAIGACRFGANRHAEPIWPLWLGDGSAAFCPPRPPYPKGARRGLAATASARPSARCVSERVWPWCAVFRAMRTDQRGDLGEQIALLTGWTLSPPRYWGVRRSATAFRLARPVSKFRPIIRSMLKIVCMIFDTKGLGASINQVTLVAPSTGSSRNSAKLCALIGLMNCRSMAILDGDTAAISMRPRPTLPLPCHS